MSKPGINARDLQDYIVRPVLRAMGMYSLAAERLVLGTIAVESDMGSSLIQKGGGSGLGVVQMEMPTAKFLLHKYLVRRDDIGYRFQRAFQVINDIGIEWSAVDVRAIRIKLLSDLRFQVGMCRLRYWVVPSQLPAAHDAFGLARYWKNHYNTSEGAGRVDKYVSKYDYYCSYLEELPA